ncbi:hypothetical protein [Nocardioides sp. Arc9.136]|uniref:hypothetical protein n=1 Tax=Nocardioides sp. Arc9.136 TaxID=2996826 RepID=UPI002665A502|nr:hypothetical protein [Nocardioides sp. Arc9.136]WKN47155.1 hypothetical protein OSR43_14015 [Nocardioides sp. Arc9.136]
MPTSTDGSLTYRLLDSSPDGPFDVDVTAHVTGTPTLTWTSIGGCETARLQINLPLSALPNLGEQSRLIVTDQQSRGIWDGYCTDPGGVDDDNGEGFDLVAVGSMVVASDRVEPLVYADAESSRWGRAAASVASGRADQTNTDGTPETSGWLLAHPEGYPIGPGSATGIEYRALEHSSQTIGGITFTLTAGAVDPGYQVQITTHHDGDLVDTVTRALPAGTHTVTMRAGVDFSTGVDVIAISLVRTGAATNVTTDLAWVKITAPTVHGARVDRYGTPVNALTPLTSRAVIEDLVGRGMLGPVDPAAAIIGDSAATHTQLAWPEGTRGAGVLSAIREDDPDMVWMFGTRGRGGYEFSWTRWPETEVRYDITEPDAVSRPGADEQPCHRVSVFYTDPAPDGFQGVRPLRRVVVELAEPGGSRVRDADPINLGDSTPDAAQAAGEDLLEKLAAAARAATATVGRRVLDRTTGLKVEPWELRPGALARIESTGEALRVTGISCDASPQGATATLTLGDPAQTLEDKLISFLRGETDPTAPLIKLPPPPTVPPTTGQPVTSSDGQPPAESPAVVWRGGIGSALLTWDLVDNYDPTTYKILIGTSASLLESEATLAGHATSDFFIARTLPNGTPFQNGVTYYARAIATDADGQAEPGPVVSGTVVAKITETEISPGAVNTPQLNTNAITTELLLANDAWLGALRATNIYGETITGPIIQTSSNANRGIKLDSVSNTLRAWDSAGNLLVSISAASGNVDIRGNVTVYSGQGQSRGTLTNVFGYGAGLAFYGQDGSFGGGLFMSDSVGKMSLWGPSGSTYFTFQPGECVVYNGGFRIVGGGISSAGGIGTLGDVVALGTVSGAKVKATSPSTPPADRTANVYMGNDGELMKVVSSARYKNIDRDAEIDPDDVLAMRPRWYAMKDDPEQRLGLGYIAEEAHGRGLTAFVDYDEDGRPDGFHYPTFAAIGHQAVLRREHAARLALEESVRDQATRIESLVQALSAALPDLDLDAA